MLGVGAGDIFEQLIDFHAVNDRPHVFGIQIDNKLAQSVLRATEQTGVPVEHVLKKCELRE